MENRLVRFLDKFLHGTIDVAAIFPDIRESWARHKAAHVARSAVADGIVIGIEKIAVLRIEFAVARFELRENKSLEEPRRVAELPFYGTAFYAGLDDAIFYFERGANPHGRLAHFFIAPQKLFALD